MRLEINTSKMGFMIFHKYSQEGISTNLNINSRMHKATYIKAEGNGLLDHSEEPRKRIET